MNLIHGDCIEEMAKMPDSWVDAIVTDPPYALEFMGKEWDSFGRKKEYKPRSDKGYGDKGILPGYGRGGSPKERVEFHKRANAGFYDFSLAWALEAFRVLKPGGHLLAFGGSRTFHRLACGIEDAGFEIRDAVAWHYGQGFPKSLDVAKADPKARDWQGWGTALKPSFEPIVVARKPLSETTVASNVLLHGTGAINIAACRISADGNPAQKGRWPSNVVLSHVSGCVKLGQKKVKGDGREPQNGERPSGFYNVGAKKGSEKPSGPLYGNPDGTETVDNWRCADGCPIKALDEQSGILKSGKMAAGTARANRAGYTGPMPETTSNDTIGDMGGASRFFYTSKAGSDERWYWCQDCKTAGCFSEAIVSPDCAQHGKNLATADLGPLFGGTETPICSCPPTPRDAHEGHALEAHVTVKPLDLMAWLIRLVTPPGGIVLDPFLGSGTTAVAAMREGFDWIGIEKSPEYVEIAKARIAKERKP